MKQMNWDELLSLLDLENIEVTIIKPVRKNKLGDLYTKGSLIGFKAGTYGAGWVRKKRGASFNSTNRRWIKKPKVLVAYNSFIFGKGTEVDWIDVDNCMFTKKDQHGS